MPIFLYDMGKSSEHHGIFSTLLVILFYLIVFSNVQYLECTISIAINNMKNSIHESI